MNYPATFKKRIPSDIFTDSMQLILNKGKAAVNQSNEYQKKQEIKKIDKDFIVKNLWKNCVTIYYIQLYSDFEVYIDV